MNSKNVYFIFLILLLLACEEKIFSPIETKQEKSAKDLFKSVIDETVETQMVSSSGITYYHGSYNSETVKDPGEDFIWYIRDYGQIQQTPKVKFSRPDHSIVFLEMTRSGSDYWVLRKSMSMTGRYYWRYVDHNENNLTVDNSWLDNTYVRINQGGTSELVWPFGNEDNSTWYNQGEWTMGCGPGCNQHTGDFYYSYDWNWRTTSPSADDGKVLESPVDGIVEKINSYYVNGYGDSWQIIVKQEYGDSYVRFAYTHIQSNTFVREGDYVYAGQPIARLGGTGASSPHAHCMLLDDNRKSIPMEFSAK